MEQCAATTRESLRVGVRRRFSTSQTTRTISAVRVDRLEQTERDPNIDSEDVKVARKVAVEDGTSDRTSAKDEHLGRVRVLGSKTKRCRILVVQLVNVLIHWSPMKSLVS